MDVRIPRALRAAAALLSSGDGPSESQVSYVLHLLKQQGLSEPTEDQIRKMGANDVSALIEGLKKKRGRPTWYGNGTFRGWEK